MDNNTLLGSIPQDTPLPDLGSDESTVDSDTKDVTTTENVEDESQSLEPGQTQEPDNTDDSLTSADKSDTSPGVQKRIDKLVAQIHDTRRENKQLHEDMKFARNHLDVLQQQIQSSSTNESIPELPEDATPEDLKTYFDEMTKRQNEMMQSNMARLEMEGKVNICRAKFADFDELHRKFETTCLNNEVLKTRIQSSDDPPGEFYKIAKGLNGENIAQEQRVTQAVAADIGGVTKSGSTSSKPEVSDDEWATVQRVFPGKFKDRNDYLKEKLRGDSIRSARRRASNGQA